LKEYSVEVSPDGKKATCWIPCQSGKEFVVKYRDGKSSTIKGRAKSVHVYTDGRKMRQYVSLPHETHGKDAGVAVSKNTIRPFVFADIRIIDRSNEDTVPDNICAKPDEIGTISVWVFVAESFRKRSAGYSAEFSVRDHPPVVIDERTKKVGEHCVSLGDEQVTKPITHYDMDYDSQKPDLVFEFRYRSMAMLQALGIVLPPKREASPAVDLDDKCIQPPPKRQRTTQSEDLIQSMQAELERLRNKVDELEGKVAGPSRVKKEAVKYDPADIIDLT